MKFLQVCLMALVLVFSSLAFSMSDHLSTIEVFQPWARASAPGAPSAGFLIIKNNSDVDDTLINVTGDFGKRLELHRTINDEGTMKMIHQKDGIIIPAHGQVEFKPGGYHLMFMGLSKAFEVGETYQVELHFERAGVIPVTLPVSTGTMDKMNMH